MNRAAKITGACLVVFGAAIFFWKIALLDLPLLPSDPEGLWGVELAIQARAGPGTASVTVPLAKTEPGQLLIAWRALPFFRGIERLDVEV